MSKKLKSIKRKLAEMDINIGLLISEVEDLEDQLKEMSEVL